MTFRVTIPSNPNCGAEATVSVEDGRVIARYHDARWDLGPGDDFRAECIAAVWRDRLCSEPPPDPKYVEPFECTMVICRMDIPCVAVARMTSPNPPKIDGYEYGYVVSIDGRLYPAHFGQLRIA